MKFEDFARRHELSAEETVAIASVSGRTVRETWESSDLSRSGVWLFWLASRVPMDQKAIARCACQCVREFAEAFPDASSAMTLVDAIEGWSRGAKSRDEVRAVSNDVVAVQPGQIDGDDRRMLAQAALYCLAKLVDGPLMAPHFAGYLTKASAQSGQRSPSEAERRLAEIVSAAFSWNDVERALAENRPSPKPRRTTVEEVAATADQRLAEYQRVLQGLEQARGQLEEVCRAQQFSLDGVSRLLNQPEIGSAVREMVATAVGKMAAADNGAASGPVPEKPRLPRRGRMMV